MAMTHAEAYVINYHCIFDADIVAALHMKEMRKKEKGQHSPFL